jgi:hypothetical protein
MVSRLFAVAFALLALGVLGVAQAACYNSQQQLAVQVITNFLANPPQLLQKTPNGGSELTSQIRDLVSSDPMTLQQVVGLIAAANKDQLDAIGRGLAQAALVCIRVDQSFATEIQYAAAATGNDALIVAFMAATGDQPTCGDSCGGPPSSEDAARQHRAEKVVDPPLHPNVHRAHFASYAHRRLQVQVWARLAMAQRHHHRAFWRRTGCRGLVAVHGRRDHRASRY